MKTFLAGITSLLLLATISPNLARSDDITYDFDNYAFQGGTTLNGTVTTDGTTGLITLTNIVGYNVTVTPPSEAAFTLSPSNSFLRVNNLNADTSTLSLSPVIFSYFTIYNPPNLLLDYEDYYSDPLVDDSFSAYDPSAALLFSSTPDQGSGAIGADPMIIATVAVPEPSTIALLTLGALGLLARRRYDLGAFSE
jgi:hypothetical protein